MGVRNKAYELEIVMFIYSILESQLQKWIRMHRSSQVLQSITPYIIRHCSILLQLVFREGSGFIESDTSRVCYV